MRISTLNLFGMAWILILGPSCGPSKQTELVWEKNLFQIGSQSSPRVADLNGDGVGDIVMGAGKKELSNSDFGVFALDGTTGDLIWKYPASAQVVGSATFYDLTEDGTPDVVIGGRNQILMALNGKDGSLIWEYEYDYEGDPILQHAQYNFYNSQLVPDQTGDGHPELLTVNGGNWLIAPDSTQGREPGVLMLFNILDGRIVAADTMPDGQESYMSPVWFTQPDSEEPLILFGSGGETLSGNLYLARLSELMDQNLSQAKVIFSEKGHGFIAPPSLADLNADGYLDILAISHAGYIQAIDGQSLSSMWENSFPGYESSNHMALGQVTRDEVPDLLVWMSKGKWPLYANSVGMVLDGSNGEVVYVDEDACFTLASPVVYDLDGDGWDEAILSRNLYDCSLTVTDEDSLTIELSNDLVAIDFQENRIQSIDMGKKFKNFFSTPWIGDLDGDGYLDIIYAHYFHGTILQEFMGMRVRRISSSIAIREAPIWGAYMGSDGRAIWPNGDVQMHE